MNFLISLIPPTSRHHGKKGGGDFLLMRGGPEIGSGEGKKRRGGEGEKGFGF